MLQLSPVYAESSSLDAERKRAGGEGDVCRLTGTSHGSGAAKVLIGFVAAMDKRQNMQPLKPSSGH